MPIPVRISQLVNLVQGSAIDCRWRVWQHIRMWNFILILSRIDSSIDLRALKMLWLASYCWYPFAVSAITVPVPVRTLICKYWNLFRFDVEVELRGHIRSVIAIRCYSDGLLVELVLVDAFLLSWLELRFLGTGTQSRSISGGGLPAILS